MKSARIEKSSPQPLYIQVQQWISGKIISGELKAKDKLPSEEDLAQMLEVSRGTIKQAIKQLVNEGLLTQIHGKGTFVIGDQLEYPLAERLVSVAETMLENQKQFVTETLGITKESSNKAVREALKLSPDEDYYYLIRLRYYDGTPVVYLENYLPVHRFPDLEKMNFNEVPLFDVIERTYHTVIEWGKRSFIAKGADERIAKLLEIEKGTPITLLEQTTYTTGDIPIEYSRVSIRNDQIKLTSILKRNQLR